MSTRVAGERRGTLTVDYADVLRQAIENERWRTMQDVYYYIESITLDRVGSNGYGKDWRSSNDFKTDLLKALRRMDSV